MQGKGFFIRPLYIFLMPSTGRQEAIARKSRETDMVSDFDNLYVLIGNENANRIERELSTAIEESSIHGDTEFNVHPRDEFRNFSYENNISMQN